ncbi:MAG: restriction endonuclease subunit S, partial [Sporolactobacillus sp.]
MSGYDKKVPKLRFPGFTDEWEERRLGEVFEQTNKIVDPSRENLELWSLTVENGLTPKTARYNREFLVKKNDQFKRVDSNEFIYNPMNMTLGAVDLNLTGKVVAVSGYYITMMAKSNFN